MRTRNISKKLVSLALTIAIIGTGSGINTLANSVNDGKNSQKAVDNKVTVVKELTDERTEIQTRICCLTDLRKQNYSYQTSDMKKTDN